MMVGRVMVGAMANEIRDDSDDLWRDAVADTPAAEIQSVVFEQPTGDADPAYGHEHVTAVLPETAATSDDVLWAQAGDQADDALWAQASDPLDDVQWGTTADRVDGAPTGDAVEAKPFEPFTGDRYYPPGYKAPKALWRALILPVTIAIVGVVIALALLT